MYLLSRVVSCPCFSALLRFSRLIGRLYIGIHTYIYICIHILHASPSRCSPVTYSQCLCYPITYRPAFSFSLYIHYPMSLNLSCLRSLFLPFSFSDSRFFLFRIFLILSSVYLLVHQETDPPLISAKTPNRDDASNVWLRFSLYRPVPFSDVVHGLPLLMFYCVYILSTYYTSAT